MFSTFLLDLQKRRHILQSRDLSAEVKEALEAFMGTSLKNISPTDLKHPPSAQNALTTLVCSSQTNATA